MPASGAATSIGYAKGAHPSGLPAVIEQLNPIYQSWSYGPGEGVWMGIAPATAATWLSGHNPYGGACWSEYERKWMVIGGGHVAACVPVPFAFNLSTLAWEWLATPLPSDGFSQLNGAGALAASVATFYPSSQYDTSWGEWRGDYSGWPNGLSQPGKIFPEVGHAYTTLMWIPGPVHGNVKGAILYISNESGRTTGGNIDANHYFDLDTNTFVRTVNKRTNIHNAAGSAIYHPGVNKAFAMTHVSSSIKNTLDVYTPSTKTWGVTTSTNFVSLPIEHGGFGAFISASLPTGLLLQFCPERIDGTAAYDGVRQRVYAVDAATAAAGSHTWSILNVSATSWPIRYDGTIATIGWAWCSDMNCFYAIDGIDNSTTLWKLSPPAGASTLTQYLNLTWSITTETLSSPIVNKNYGGLSTGAQDIYNRLRYDTTSKCLLFVQNWYEGKVQAIRPHGL